MHPERCQAAEDTRVRGKKPTPLCAPVPTGTLQPGAPAPDLRRKVQENVCVCVCVKPILKIRFSSAADEILKSWNVQSRAREQERGR